MTTCKKCGTLIDFRRTSAGNLQPVDADGGDVHFATCGARVRRELPENCCHRCGSTSVVRGPGTETYYASLRCEDCRTFRWLPRRAS